MEKKRCGIYCRKSVEDREEKDFNSIDAQREAGENYIASQKANGWVCLPERYDDYGFSGGNTNRPALKKLLKDCEDGLVDTIVVYKIDRLSRSIADFAELSRKLDKWGVSFTSVTQEINTGTSAGRMMLNILMTFASFEREQIAERIKDKMSASRKKGMWVGGLPPLGYRVENKKLVIVPEAADEVRYVFRRFIETQSPKLIAYELNRRGVKTKYGNPWAKDHIHRMLNNYTYIGQVNYQGEVCEGEQAGIIDRETWDRVHEILAANNPVKEPRGKVEIIAPLKGVMRCGYCGGAMSPTYARKGRKTYYYYICAKDEKRGERICPIGRLPAGDMERIVRGRITELLSTPEMTVQIAEQVQCDPAAMREFFKAEMWDGMNPAEQNRLIRLLVEKITVQQDSLEFEFKTKGVKFIMENIGNE